MNRFSARQQEKYDNTSRCYICRHEFVEGEVNSRKVRDNITSCFIGAAHRQCYLERPVCFKIQVFFHNILRYDAHYIDHEFGIRPDREMKVIGQSIKSICKSSGAKHGISLLTLISVCFTGAACGSLAKVDRENLQNLNNVVTDVYPETDVELLEEQGVLSYDYLYFFARLDEPALPLREAFFNKLVDVDCLLADYAHAQHVLKNFHCSNLKKYMLLY